ncbi:MAG: serine/threonine-protein kinase [Deltaproteobacteria bacterium]|nr:serine/threonine-protein kinase [Deltaproteobacteria bacterium]
MTSPSTYALTRLCANCGFRLEASLLRCPIDGLTLAPASENNAMLGPYRLLRRLGRGGMGVVYEAENQRLGRTVAIKLLHRALRSDQVVVDRFFLEARAVNTIRHPHVVQTYDLVADPQDLYMVMEYLEGDDLAHLLSKSAGQPWPVARAVHVLEQICGALQVTHRRGIVHRDLKPANIFLTRAHGKEDYVKVLDFGIAKLGAGGKLTQEGLTMGTPEYMSPEQVRGEDIDGRSDLYGLACIAFELLTGYQLFGGGSQTDVMLSQLHTPPQSLRRFNKDIPAALDAVILRCLAKDAWDRPSTAYEMARALAEAVGLPFDVSGAFAALTPSSLPKLSDGRRPTTGALPPVAGLREPSGGDEDELPRRRWMRSLTQALPVAVVLFVVGGVVAWRSRAAAPPADPGPAAVNVQVQSQPAGAEVIDVATHQTWGFTPLQRQLLPGSQQSVQIRHAGFVPAVQTFTVESGGVVAVALVPERPAVVPPPAAAPSPPAEPAPPRVHKRSLPQTPPAKDSPPTRVGTSGTIDPFAP